VSDRSGGKVMGEGQEWQESVWVSDRSGGKVMGEGQEWQESVWVSDRSGEGLVTMNGHAPRCVVFLQVL
jgi:frataxin-like iron-binding protein CyaY